MPGPVIRLGDQTSHGGRVLEASQHSDIDGIAVARLGDNVSCPIHGNGTIVEGDMTTLVDGTPVARHGDKTACGAVLAAGQQTTVDRI